MTELNLDEVEETSGGLGLPSWVSLADFAVDFLKGLRDGSAA
jgi:hypothetical protein